MHINITNRPAAAVAGLGQLSAGQFNQIGNRLQDLLLTKEGMHGRCCYYSNSILHGYLN